MKKIVWVITIALLIAAFCLRFYKYENNSGFDWDQNRDYGEVKQIASGKPVILGPVAKGSGGFYLGSLYYYILVPAYTFMDHSLYALPLTSIVIDSIFVACIFLVLYKITGKKVALIVSVIWATCWLMIGASRVSWNVALVPIWSLFTLYSIYKVVTEKSRIHLYLLGLLLGLTIHIHVSIIPIIPIFALLYFRHLRFAFRDWIFTIILMIVPIIPLIIYDLNHGFLNAHLLRNQLGTQAIARTSIWQMMYMSMVKLGKVVSGIFFAKFSDNIFLGIITTILAIKSAIFDKKLLSRLAGQTILISIFLIIVLGDYGFPEYYFAAAYLAIIVLFVMLLSKLPSILMYPIFSLIIVLNLLDYSIIPTGFSLKYKYDMVATLKDFKEPIDMSYQFDPGRDGGFRYIIELFDIKTDPKSRTRILLTDKLNTPLYIDGELARDLSVIGNFKSALYIVQ